MLKKCWMNDCEMYMQRCFGLGHVKQTPNKEIPKFVHKQQHSKLYEMFSNYFIMSGNTKTKLTQQNKHNLHFNKF